MKMNRFDHHARSAFTLVFLVTIPVMLGYLAIGVAFGLLLVHAGYPVFLAPVMSVLIYAGAAQYIAVGLFTAGTGAFEAGVVTLLVNSRHMMYGLSLLEQFRGAGRFKPYLVFSLTDETYALLTSVKVPEGIDPGRFYFTVSVLDQFYWVAGSTIGAIIGGVLPFNTQGLEFALTALFVVLLIEQVKNGTWKLPFFIALGSCAAIVLAAGTKNMLILSLLLSVAVLLAARKLEPRSNGEPSAAGGDGGTGSGGVPC